MNSSGSVIPIEAVFSNLRVHMDPFWYTELIGKGLNIKTELPTFPRLMDEVSFYKFPLHNRRMKVFQSQQTGDTLSFLREIIENIRVAEWHTFNEEAAVNHIFMNFTKCEESKWACYKILSDWPQDNTKSLIAKLQAIEAFPDKETSVKPINLCEGHGVRKSLTTCKFKGHLSQDCWGKCKFCGRYGHKSHLCRNKPQEDSEPAKKASDGNKEGKPKGKKKRGRKEKAKRVAELIDSLRLDSPANSSDEETSEDSDISPSVLNIRKIQEHQTPSSRRAARANEFADWKSDQKVIQTLNRTHLEAKVKTAKTAQGQSHTEGKISNSMDFRNSKAEMFLLDSGVGVNIIGEDIAID